jgi:hypothetical protein
VYNIAVKFEIISALPKKVAVFWSMTPCRSGYRHKLFGEVCCIHQNSSQRRMFTLGLPESNCSKPLQNVGTYMPIYVASYLRTLEFTVVQLLQICGLQTLGGHRSSFKTLQT